MSRNIVSRKIVSRKRIGGAALLCAALMTACADDPGGPPTDRTPTPGVETRSVAKPVMSSIMNSPPTMATCGTTGTYQLWTNPYVPGGSVTVSNDAERIYVTYSVTHADWFITDTRLAVEKNKASIPMVDANTPSPWEFKNAGDHEPAVKSFTYSFALTTIGARAGETVHVAAMTGVVYPVTGNYEGAWEWRTAWGVPQGQTSPLIQSYVIQGCGGTQPPPPPPTPTPTAGAVITITFDDGWLDTYTVAYPVLRDLGLVANMAINSEPVDGRWTTYMTLAQIKTLKAAGWSVQNHSTTHPDLTKITAAKLESEISANKAWIANNGLGDSPVFIVPFHSWGARERAVIQKYHVATRGATIDQFWPAKYTAMPITEPHDLTGFEPEYAPFKTAEGRALTMSYVKRAVDDGKFIDLFFHRISTADKPAFAQLMKEIAVYKANIRTYDDIF